MITTRTDDELRQLIVPELADHITACEEGYVRSRVTECPVSEADLKVCMHLQHSDLVEG